MGGALCLLLHLRESDAWDGIVLIALMCKISDRIRPRWSVPEILTLEARVAPTDDLGARLSEVTAPFLVLHGSDDVVTDPEVSQALYKAAQSKDKTIKIYQGMLHSLLFGEPDENIAMVRNDILAWLNERSKSKEHQQTKAAAALA